MPVHFMCFGTGADPISSGKLQALMPYSLYASYKKSSLPSTRHCTWILLIWKRHSIVYTDVSSGLIFTSLALRSGWCSSYRACLKMPEADCVLVATWVKSSVWKWVFTKALAWAPYCSSWFWKPSAKSFEQDVPGKTLVIITESLEELQKKLIPWKTIMERKGQHGQNQGPDIWAGAWCASEVWQRPLCHMSQGRQHKLHFLWWLFQLGPQKCSGISGPLKPDPGFRCKWCTGQVRPVDGRPMTEVTMGREKLEMMPSFCYLGGC